MVPRVGGKSRHDVTASHTVCSDCGRLQRCVSVIQPAFIDINGVEKLIEKGASIM